MSVFPQSVRVRCSVQADPERQDGTPVAELVRIDRDEGSLGVMHVSGYLLVSNLRTGRVYDLVLTDVTDGPPARAEGVFKVEHAGHTPRHPDVPAAGLRLEGAGDEGDLYLQGRPIAGWLEAGKRVRIVVEEVV